MNAKTALQGVVIASEFKSVDPELVQRVTARMASEPSFLKDALTDINAAVKTRMDIDLPVPLRLLISDGSAFVAPRQTCLQIGGAKSDGELNDSELDVVSADRWRPR